MQKADPVCYKRGSLAIPMRGDMHQDADISVGVGLRVRYLAACLALLLAISLGCGISAAALANDFDSFDTPDSIALVSEQFDDHALPETKLDSAKQYDGLSGPFVIALVISDASIRADGQVAVRRLQGGIPRVIHPTGPPSAHM